MNLEHLFWDYQIPEVEIEELLQQNDLSNNLTVSLYNRILSSYRWYDILKLLTPAQLENALSERVINTIFSKHLRERYSYAARKMLKR